MDSILHRVRHGLEWRWWNNDPGRGNFYTRALLITTIHQYKNSAGYASYSRVAIDNIARNTGQLVHRTATKARKLALAFNMSGATVIVPVGGGPPIAIKAEGEASLTEHAPPVASPVQHGDDDSEDLSSQFEPAILAVKHGMHPRERAMLEKDFHRRMLHLGRLSGCKCCESFKQKPRRIMARKAPGVLPSPGRAAGGARRMTSMPRRPSDGAMALASSTPDFVVTAKRRGAPKEMDILVM